MQFGNSRVMDTKPDVFHLFLKMLDAQRQPTGFQFSLRLLELKMKESVLGIDIESRVAETEPVLDDLSSKSSQDSLCLGDHSSKK